MKCRFKIFLTILCSFSMIAGCSTTGGERKISEKISKDRKKVNNGFYYMVEKGDTLSKIAENYEVSTETISDLNHLPDDNKIKPGQLLYIPKSLIILKKDQKKVHFIWPVKGEVVELFNNKKEKGKINLGIDIKFKPTRKVVAAEEGEVVFCSDSPEFNFNKSLVTLEHKSGFTSVYLLDGKILVSLHQLVSRGEPILEANSKSDNILHFEIRRNHIPKNPYYFLP